MQRFALIENDPLIALDVAKALKASGHGTVTTFPDCAAWLDASTTVTFDLILLDLDSGGLGFDELLERTTSGGPRIFLISSLADDEALRLAKRADSVDLLRKPFSRRELVGALEIGLYRAKMEERLSLSVRRYRNLFDASLSPRCISSFPLDGGLLLERNDAFSALFPQVQSLRALFVRPEDWDGIGDSLAAGERVAGKELQMLGRGDSILQVVGSFSVVMDERQDKPLVSTELVDITESRRLWDELLQAQKMESLGRLSGGIAHDFNNILTAIKGHAELLAMETDSGDESYQDVQGIRKAAEKATALTRQLLGFSRKQAYAPRAVDLAELLRDVSSLLRKLAGDGVAFSVAIPEGVFPLVADPVRIEQVLVNLVVNARDALEGSSKPFIRLGLEAESLGEGRSIGGRSLPAGDYYRVEVSDNGSGMSAAVAAKIFTPFFTTKAPGKGTGLGLATVADIVRDMSGAIDVTTAAGEGSSFAFWLPASPGPSLNVAKQTPHEAPKLDLASFHLGGRPELLLVDGDESVLGFACYALDRAGAKVVTSANAGEALIFAERRHFDAFVLDLPLSGIDGLELYGRLKNQAKRGLPCVFTSGKDWPEERGGVPEGTIFLEKPYSPADLVAALASVLPSGPSTAS